MGGGGGGVAAAEDVQERLLALIADLERVTPWKCAWPGCPLSFEKGATHTFIEQHMKNHTYAEKKEQQKLANRDADRAFKLVAAGPSGQRKKNRLLPVLELAWCSHRRSQDATCAAGGATAFLLYSEDLRYSKPAAAVKGSRGRSTASQQQ